jgi:hypothetical protein
VGLDLSLLPLEASWQLDETLVWCYDRLNFNRDDKIFCQLIDCGNGNKPTIKAKPIPPQLWVKICRSEGIKQTRKDDYDNELTFVYAQQLKKLKMSSETSPKNKAIISFVCALPDDIPIILLWN